MATDERPETDGREPTTGEPSLGMSAGPGSGPGGMDATPGGEAARRRALPWGRILLVWVVVTSPLLYMVHQLMEPRYEAVSLLRVEPAANNPYMSVQGEAAGPDEIRPFLSTQVSLITSDRALDTALSRPGISSLAMIRNSRDPRAELRERLQLSIVGNNTYLIRVSLESRNPVEAAEIVNAVVIGYIEQHTMYHKTANRALKLSLETELQKLDRKISEAEETVERLVQKGSTVIAPRPRAKAAGKEASESPQPSLSTYTQEQLARAADRLLDADFDLIDSLARLDTARLPGSLVPAQTIRELEAAVEEARQRQARYARYIQQMEVRTEFNPDQFRATRLIQDLAHWKRLAESVKLRLAQLEFEIGQADYRISVVDNAVAPTIPRRDARFTVMAATPVGVFLLTVGLFLAIESAGARRLARTRPL